MGRDFRDLGKAAFAAWPVTAAGTAGGRQQSIWKWPRPRAASALHAKNDVHDALYFTELLRVQVVGHLDVFVVRPGDLENKAGGCEFNETQAKVASVGIVTVGLDVADAAIIVLKLTLNDKIGVIHLRKIKVIVARGLAIERDLEVLVAGLSNRYVISVESQWAWPCFSAYHSSRK
jgi:hypothetical protein